MNTSLTRAGLLLGLGLALLGAGRPDAPAQPGKGDYTWDEPKDWTPPTLEALQKWDWKAGRITTGPDLARERYARLQPSLSDAEALALPNDGKEANEKILATLSRPPRDDGEVDWDATVNRVADGAPGTLNYILYSSKYENWICLLIYAGAFSFDHEMKPFADGQVVREWKTSPMADLVVLRDDLRWEDGTPFSAYDIEFTYHAIMDNRINVPAVRSGTEELKWVKAYDAHTVVFFYKEPMVTNIWNCQFPILPKHIYSPGLADDPTMRTSEWNVYWNFHPLASGPYRLKEHQTNQFVLLERRDDWFLDKEGKQVRPKPYVREVRFRILPEENTKLLAFKKGDVDEMMLNARQWVNETGDPDFQRTGIKVNGVDWAYAYMGWNQKPIPDAPFFKDRRVRLAMTYAINHKEILEKVNYGLFEPGTGPFHPQSWMASPGIQPYQQDLDKAEALLDEAGWIDSDGDGVRDKTIDGKNWKFEFTLNFGQGSPLEKAAVLLKGDLESIGVLVNIKGLEWATYQQTVLEHRFEAQTANWGTGTDPDTAKNLWKSEMYKEGRNYIGYSNPEVDRLFDAGSREFDAEKRKAIYQKIHQLIWEDQPYTFLYFRRSLWAFNQRLRGYNFSPRDSFSYTPGFLSVWVAKK